MTAEVLKRINVYMHHIGCIFIFQKTDEVSVLLDRYLFYDKDWHVEGQFVQNLNFSRGTSAKKRFIDSNFVAFTRLGQNDFIVPAVTYLGA